MAGPALISPSFCSTTGPAERWLIWDVKILLTNAVQFLKSRRGLLMCIFDNATHIQLISLPPRLLFCSACSFWFSCFPFIIFFISVNKHLGWNCLLGNLSCQHFLDLRQWGRKTEDQGNRKLKRVQINCFISAYWLSPTAWMWLCWQWEEIERRRKKRKEGEWKLAQRRSEKDGGNAAVGEVALGRTSRAKRYGWMLPSPAALVRFQPGSSLCDAVLSVTGW